MFCIWPRQHVFLVFLLVLLFPAFSAKGAESSPAWRQLADLEAATGGRLGVSALDTATGRRIQYRAEERFPLCSTFKAVLVAAVLKQHGHDDAFMQKNIAYTATDLVVWSPVTERHVAEGMRVLDLCVAALQISDNTAANLLLREIGGPEKLTAFARSIGDTVFRLDRWEPDLNSAEPGDPRDTTSPAAMEETLGRLVLGNTLSQEQKERFADWLKGNTTGGESIRAGVPAGWIVGDKTGSGRYGTGNDIAVIWPPDGKPIVLAVYFTQAAKDAPARKDVLASAARICIESLREGLSLNNSFVQIAASPGPFFSGRQFRYPAELSLPPQKGPGSLLLEQNLLFGDSPEPIP